MTLLEHLDNRSSGYSNDLITSLEILDARFGQKFLRKSRKYDQVNFKYVQSSEGSHYEEYFGSKADGYDSGSFDSRHENDLESFFNRDVVGGDMSPYRLSKLVFNRTSIDLKKSKNMLEVQQVRSIKRSDTLDHYTEKFEGPAVELPGLNTTKAAYYSNYLDDAIDNRKLRSTSYSPEDRPPIIDTNINEIVITERQEEEDYDINRKGSKYNTRMSKLQASFDQKESCIEEMEHKFIKYDRGNSMLDPKIDF